MAIQKGSPLLEVNDLRVHYRLAHKNVLKAVDGVTFSMNRGDRLGLVGESGCGKTSLAMACLGLLPNNAQDIGGKINFEGRNIAGFSEKEWRQLRWKKISMVFQAAMNALDPVYRVRKQLSDVYRLHHKCSREEEKRHIEKLITLTGLPIKLLNNFPHQLSGGMKQRVIIAMSLICNPSLIIADEPTTGLDVIIQDQIMREILDLLKQFALSMILISHDISIVIEVCNKVMVMYGGKMVEFGDIFQVFDHPSHPYTIGLFRSFPSIRGPIKKLESVPGTPPNLADNLVGCRFYPRCPRREELCKHEDPPVVEINKDHMACCHFAKDPDLKNIKFGELSD